MTACTNKARGAVVAALAGVLALGAVPAVALATGSDVSLQFAEPDGAFSNGEVRWVWFEQLGTGNWVKPDAKGVYHTEYDAYHPVVLSAFEVHFFGTAESDNFKVDLASGDYEVAYYNRDSKGMPTGDEITSDIYNVGSYVAKVTAVSGDYEGGTIYVPFDIDPIEIKNVTVDGAKTVTYDAETHDFSFRFDRKKVYEGTDYTVEYVKTGHDTSAATEVKDEGTYVAKITGIGNYAGTVTLSEQITVEPLDLSKAPIVGLITSADKIEPKNLYAICINGEWHTGDDAIMSELKAELDPDSQVWFENKSYNYKVTEAQTTDNIDSFATFTAVKVAHELDFSYNGAALDGSYEVIKNDSSTHWDGSKLSAHAADGTIDGVTVKGTDMHIRYVDENGNDVNAATVNGVAGKYTAIISYVDNFANGKVGGIALVSITTYQEAVNADAKAAVIYDADGDGMGGKVVTSLTKTYDGKDLASRRRKYIRVAVEDSYGANVSDKCSVKFYNAEGKEVGKVIDAGTYTLKVTSDVYKLTGTTEMTITVNKLDLSTVKADAVQKRFWDKVGNVTEYLPWQDDGVTLDQLQLKYQDADGKWVDLPMDVIKATILDSEGNEVKKIVDEGVYTVHFEGRNPNADNYVVPADITVTCIKNGKVPDKNGNYVSHLRFTDVEWSDYFANAVDLVAKRSLMTGYQGTNLFGADNTLNRGQMAIVLYNMAKFGPGIDESSLKYDETKGYKTGFDDVDGNMYYAKAIAWARQAGVVNGYDETHFGPEDNITREEFAAMIMNYEKKFGDYEQADASVLDDFSDAASITPWAKNAMSWAVANGVVNGTPEGTLIPTCDILRGDAACMVYNYVK